MLELRGLGTVGLHDERGELLAVSPKPLALLVYLAVARPRGPQQRDTLLALFHPELDQRHARTALRQLVHVLKTVVGDDVVRSDRQTVALEPGRLTCDVHSFEAALATADRTKAVELYKGPFLPGFFLSGCPEFEQWVDAERSRLQRAYAGALEQLALEADAAGDTARAVSLWRQLAEVDPYATRVTVRLIAALELAGDRAGALQVAESHAQRLKQELDAEPSPEVEALASRLRAQPVPSTPVPGGSTRERLARAVAGRYRVDRVAGAGGMALVYLAEDMKLGRPVALKVLRPELAAAIGHERFLNEVDIAAGLAHPNILPLHDAGEANGLVYYVMPYVEGESLRARLAREGPLELGDAVRITREVADALGHAHERGIVHRDIKPANILLLADHAVVSDFGVARALGNAVEDRALVATTGTPAYMSPEQAAGSPDVDARSDLYSLGCVLHEMLTGAPPQRESGSQPVLAATSAEQETVPATVEAALAKALAPAPDERFATAGEFAEALTAEHVTAAATPAATKRPARHRVALFGVALVIIIGGAAILSQWVFSGETGTRHLRSATGLRSIAVLPCDNLSRDPRQEYISDHYAEQIIAKLSQVGSLTPKSWRAMRSYKGTDKSSQQIASELGAGTLVTCQILENEQGARLAVQLIEPGNDDIIWSNDYQTLPLPDSINAIQTDAARQIAAALGASVLAREQELLSQPPTQDHAALNLYRLGRHFFYQVRTDAFQLAVEYFEQAIEADSSFSLAYSWLADALTRLYEDNMDPYRARIEELTNRALELDSTSAHAHTMMGLLKGLFLRSDDWETWYQNALRFAPNSPEAHLYYGFQLAMERRYDEGLAEMMRAEELDPTNPFVQGNLAQFLTRARRYDEAEEAALRGLQFNPGAVPPSYALGFTYLARGDYREGLALLEEVQEQIPSEFGVIAFVGYGYGKVGRREDAEETLDRLLELSRQQYVQGNLFARVYAGLGDVDSVYYYLADQFRREGEAACWWVTEQPLFDEYRTDPRLQRLLTETGCPAE